MGSVSMDCMASMDCLPDDLLVQILSLLPTKEAVTTSILSKRWRTLFAFSHNLDFEFPVVWLHGHGSMRKSFIDFADSSLALQSGKHIEKFSLTNIVFPEDEPEVVRWICNALEHGISELHLNISTLSEFALPSKVFTSTTLVKLSLGTYHITSLPWDTSLPALKILFLDSIWFDGDQLADLFLAACPALEDLTIHYHSYSNHSFVISGKTIKKLSVTYDCNYHFDDSRIISLETPSVVDLHYSDYPWCEFPRCQLDSLAKATLDLRFFKDDKRYPQNGADVTNLISGIRNVKTLHLTSSTVEVISVCCKGGLPKKFNNLNNLVFSSNKRRGWRVFLPLLLERSPNLKTLVLSDLHRYTFGPRHRFVGIQIPPNNQIKMLRIMQYQGYATELKHISHILLKMECLEVLQVYVAPTMDDPKKMRLRKEMLKLPTSSSNLKIQVM